MDTKFIKALKFVQLSEGGTNNDPDDRGGLTNHGISQKQYPNLDIANLTITEAAEIYHQDYWLKNRCHLFAEPLATVLFDSSVNCGANSAAKWLQRTCNINGSELKLDGSIGSLTVLEVIKYSPCMLMSGIIAYRLKRYTSLLRRSRSQYKFINGWINRVSDLLIYIQENSDI